MNQILACASGATYDAGMPSPHNGSYSPTIRRRRLSEELKRLRLAADLTLEEAADRLEWSRAKIANIETGKRKRPNVTDVDLLLTVYGITDDRQRQALLTLTRQAREKGWWTNYDDFLKGSYVGFEAEASMISTYQWGAIPGLLQTRAYAAASAQAALVPRDGVERVVEARMRRQEILHRDVPPTLWAIIDESVVKRPAVAEDPAVMLEQLRYLVDIIEATNSVTVQVLPLNKGLHAGTGGGFVLLEFANPLDRPIVYLETRSDDLYLEADEELSDYRLVLDHLKGTALSPKDSLSYLTQLSKDDRVPDPRPDVR